MLKKSSKTEALRIDLRCTIADPDEITLFLPEKDLDDSPGQAIARQTVAKYGILMRYCLLCPAIKLDKGYRALVDPEDYVTLNRTGWKTKKAKHGTYAIKYYSDKGRRRGVYLSRRIKGTAPGLIEHHRNGYTMDYRKQNLQTMRPADHQATHQAKRISGIIGGKARLKIQKI